VGQIIVAIRDLQSDWSDTDLTFLSLASQLSALRLALTKIEEWLCIDTGDAHHQLVMDLDASINCCTVLLAKLQDLVDSLRQKENKVLDFQSKLKLVFGKKSIDDIQKLLQHQTNALSLLLAACNWFVLSLLHRQNTSPKLTLRSQVKPELNKRPCLFGRVAGESFAK
jgi:hypothetical protein